MLLRLFSDPNYRAVVDQW